MSLEERIRRFAEQARGYLLEEFAKSLQQDTTVVKWQGYDQDGKLVVKNKDLTPTADGVGQKYVTKGSDLILDSTGSVEQRKSKRKQEVAVPEKQIIPLRPLELVPRSANPIIDLFFLEELDDGDDQEFLPIFELPSFNVGLHVVISKPIQGGGQLYGIGVYANPFYKYLSSGWPVTQQNNTIGGSVPNDTLYDENWQQEYGYYSVGGYSYRLATYVVPSGRTVINGPPTVTTRANGGDKFDVIKNLSGSDQSDSGFNWTAGLYNDSSSGFAYYSRNVWYYLFPDGTPQSSGQYGGWADTEVSFADFARSVTEFYYQMSFGTRTIDLKDIVGDNIYWCNLERNFAKFEGEEIFIYSTFRVATVDIGSSADCDLYTGPEYDLNKVVGKVSRYWVHTRLNFRTGEVESKTVQSTTMRDTGPYANEPFYNYEYLFHVYGNEFSINTDLIQSFNGYQLWNPIHAWQNCFEGDWMYAYRDMEWSSTDDQYVSNTEMYYFFQCAYRNGRWYKNLENINNPYPFGFYEWIPNSASHPSYAIGEPPASLTTIQKIEQLPIIIELYGDFIDTDDYFGGQYSTSPNDKDDWVIYNPGIYTPLAPFQNEDPYGVYGAYTYVQPLNLAPQFTSPTNVASINENGPANQVVYTAAVADEDNSANITYQLEETDDYSYFNMNNADVRLTDPADYETKNSYVFTIIATDTQGAYSKLTLTLQILDVAE